MLWGSVIRMDQAVQTRRLIMPYSIWKRKKRGYTSGIRQDGFGNRALLPLYDCESKETRSVDSAVLREDREGKAAAVSSKTGGQLSLPDKGVSEPGEKV